MHHQRSLPCPIFCGRRHSRHRQLQCGQDQQERQEDAVHGGIILGACRAWSAESENWPQRVQFLPDLQPNSQAIGQKAGEKWAAAADLQPAISKSDRLPGHGEVDRVGAQQRWELWATQAAAAQSQFNSAITQHNLAVNQFPAVVLARLFGFRPAGSL